MHRPLAVEGTQHDDTLGGVTSRDWWEWHQQMDDPASALSRRLSVVQEHLKQELDRCPADVIRVISLCPGKDGI